MTWFDSVCHTFATLATGGFSTHSASVAHFDSAAVEWIITVFMLLAGVNFLLYYYMARRGFKDVLRDTELRVYLLFVLICSVVVTWNLYGMKIVTTAGSEIDMAGAMESIRYAVFQVVAIQTTTGFCTADFDQWDPFSKAVLLGLMFVGGSAGSTGGGLKVFRVIVTFKVMLAEVERIFRPNVVRTIKVGKEPIPPEARLATLVYVLGIFALFAAGTILIMLFENQYSAADSVDFGSAVTASAATLNNIGPGLGQVGATQNYGWFSQPSLVVMSVLMALGRLEVYAVFVLFLPRFWHGD
jgi:trk system potassium uptake protein TrkH